MERRKRIRQGVYGVIVILAIAVWYPYAMPVVKDWLVARHTRATIALVYTTDTRGFLESCG